MIGLTLAMSLIACGSSQDSAAQLSQQQAADTAAINQIETKWHEAVSLKKLDMMMSLWADNSVMETGSRTLAGKDQIRNFFATQAAPFQPGNHWISETPAYKIRITVAGDTATLYFECHYIDVDTRSLKSATAADLRVARFNGQWMITSGVTSTVPLTP